MLRMMQLADDRTPTAVDSHAHCPVCADVALLRPLSRYSSHGSDGVRDLSSSTVSHDGM